MPFWKSRTVCEALLEWKRISLLENFYLLLFTSFYFIVFLMGCHRAFVTSSLNYIKDEAFLHLFMSLCLASLLIKIFLCNTFVLFPLFKCYVKEPQVTGLQFNKSSLKKHFHCRTIAKKSSVTSLCCVLSELGLRSVFNIRCHK